MRKNGRLLLVSGALAACGLLGCDRNTAHIEAEEAAGERAEEAAEERAEAQGYGPLDQEIKGQVARKRAELAVEVGADAAALVDEPVGIAAEELHEPGDPYDVNENDE